MSLKALIDLANQDLPPRVLTPAEQKAYLERMAAFDHECLERQKNRVLTQEQLQKTCDYHARNP